MVVGIYLGATHYAGELVGIVCALLCVVVD